MVLIDGHCHLANTNEKISVQPLLEDARHQGITGWLSSALTRADLAWYRENKIEGLRHSAGMHPNFELCNLRLEDILQAAEDKRIWAVGEIGLDRGNPDLQGQLRLLKDQLEIAKKYELPVVLHLVGHQPQAYEVLRHYPLRYLVHGYAGSLEGFDLLSRLDAVFTISERILRSDKHGLLKTIVDYGGYLFETDITQYYLRSGEANPLLRLLDVVRGTAEILGLDRADLIREQEVAFCHLIGD